MIGFIERYECILCGEYGERDETIAETDTQSVPELPGKLRSRLCSIIDRVRDWRRDAANEGKDPSSIQPDGYERTFAVSTTFLWTDDSTTGDDE